MLLHCFCSLTFAVDSQQSIHFWIALRTDKLKAWTLLTSLQNWGVYSSITTVGIKSQFSSLAPFNFFLGESHQICIQFPCCTTIWQYNWVWVWCFIPQFLQKVVMVQGTQSQCVELWPPCDSHSSCLQNQFRPAERQTKTQSACGMASD